MVPDQLDLTPGILRALITGLSEAQMTWKPAPERFSIAEALAHLAHAEQHAYAPKYRRFGAPEDSRLEPYDTEGLFARGEYSGVTGAESLADFENQRRANLDLVRHLPDRTLTHNKVGPISLSHLLNECAYHDLGHIRQIAELVRAVRYYPNMGLYSKFYKVNP